jgi:hypothetical protein
MSMLTRNAPGSARLFVGMFVCASSLTASSLQAQARHPPCRQSEVFGWVAELPKKLAQCPKPNANWKLRTFPLDEGTTRKLCSYEWRPSSTPTKAGLPSGLEYSADCMAIGVALKEQPFVSQPDGPTSEDVAAVEEDFLDAIDAPLRMSRAQTIAGDERPVLAFIDALPVQASVPQDGSIQHGNSLQRLAKLIGLCTDRSCRFDFDWLGKPALYPYPRGEVAGSPLDSADSVLETIGSYRANPGENLVISLGLGFEAEARCASLPKSPVVSALREAIRRAACETGAIVLAPVGNKRGDDVTTGMLYPAAFAAEELHCNGVPRGRPLVVAISGVDLELHPLESSRANAPLMTIGGPFAYEGKGLDEQLNPRTASSVAVAAAGPIVSIAWYLRPDLDAAGLIKALSKAGTPSGSSRIIRACRTWEKLCSNKQLGRCSDLATLCSGVPSVSGLEVQPIAAPRATAPQSSVTGAQPDYCLGRGQRIEPSGPGE